jgi:succinyl-diaminopimelate desuccinylase
MHQVVSLRDSVIDLASWLVRYPSVTPDEAGCLMDLHRLLQEEGFVSHLVRFGDTTNLYARFGRGSPYLCFAGHIDVVPPGHDAAWTFPPFEPTVHEGLLYGRGVADMKGAVACILSAFQAWRCTEHTGSFGVLLTSDEEGIGIDGIPKMIPWLRERNEVPDVFLIGEPTGRYVGEVLQIGRRGSVTATLSVRGKQGHIAYPHLANNPIPHLIACVRAFLDLSWDKGSAFFPPTHLAMTAIETGNPTMNLIPRQVEARLGIRFNPCYTSQKLYEILEGAIVRSGGDEVIELAMTCHGNPFLTSEGPWLECVQGVMRDVLGESPRLTTQGGTSDGRFLHVLAPVLELGLPETTIHQVDEHVAVSDLETLKTLYTLILKRYLSSPPVL